MRRLMALFLFLLIPTMASAVPVQVPYSGQLSESGTRVNGTRYITINLYDAPVGGTLIRSQSDSLVLADGVYHTYLLTLLGDWSGERWVGVAVNSGSELTPRTFVGSVPHAVRATFANQLINPPLAGASTTNTLSFVTTAAWTKIDSVSFTTTGLGSAVITATGYVEPTGIGGVWGVQYAISPTSNPSHATMAGFMSVTNSTTPIMPISLTQLYQVFTAGPQKYYLWARMSGGAIQSLHHHSPMVYLFTPNP